MLDVGHPDEHRLGRGGHPHGVRPQPAGDPAGDDRVLVAVLVGAQQLLAEVVVDGGVGAAPGRARERHRAGALALAADQQLRGGADERRVAPSDGVDERGVKRLAQQAEDGRRIVRPGGVHVDLAGQHDLLQLAGADPLGGARHRLLEVGGRHRAHHLVGARGSGIEQRQRRLAQLGQPPLHARHGPGLGVVGGDVEVDRQPGRPAAPRQRYLGDDQRSRRKAAPDRRSTTVGGEREAAQRHQPGGRGPRGLVGERVGRHRAPAAGQRLEAPGARGLERPHRPQRRHRDRVAVGLLQAEPRLAGTARGDHDRAGVVLTGRARR